MAGLTWIKLNIDMFDNKKIKQIRKVPGGNDMVLFWVMLLSLAGKANSQGYILFTENIPYTPEMLSNEFDMPINTVKMALELFNNFNMTSVTEKTISITGWAEYQNVQGMERAKMLANERVRRHRENKKMLLKSAEEETCSEECNVTDTLQQPLCNGDETDIKREDIKNKDIRDIDKEREEESSLIDESLEVCKYYEAATHGKSISQYINEIKMLVEMYTKSWVLEAVDITINKNVYSMKYIKTILMNWAKDGKSKKNDNISQPKQGVKNSNFNNFPQRKYDFDDLEKKLLGWDDQDSSEVEEQ